MDVLGVCQCSAAICTRRAHKIAARLPKIAGTFAHFAKESHFVEAGQSGWTAWERVQ